MNEIITLENPNGNLEKAEAICSAILKRRDEIAADIDANPVTADNWNSPETEAKTKELESAIEDLRERGKKLVAKIIEETCAFPIITAIDNRLVTYSTKKDPCSAYGSLSRRLDERKDIVKQFKLANMPVEPTERWLLGVTMTNTQKKAVLKAIEKTGAVVEYTEKQKDEAKQ